MISSENLGDAAELLGVDHALGVFLEVPRLHSDEVDETPEVGLGAHRDLGGDGVGAEALLHGVDGVEEVGADAVVLVDERDAGHAVLGGLAPHGLGLRLDAGDGIEDGDGAVEDAQAALDLGREVHVARGIDDLEAVGLAVLDATGVVPEARGGSGGDGHAALLLLDHPVHGSGAVVDLAHLVRLSGVVKDTLGRRGLARIDVGHDPDVSRIV